MTFYKLSVSNLNVFIVNSSLSNSEIYILPGNYNSMSYIIYFASSISIALLLFLVISIVKFRKKKNKKLNYS